MKKAIALLLAFLLLLTMSACGKKGPDATGKYLCKGVDYGYGKYDEPSDEIWIELKKGGKGTYFESSYKFDLKWELSGENFSGKVVFLGLETPIEGTLKDGVLDVQYGTLNYRFAKEGAQIPDDIGNTGVNQAPEQSAFFSDVTVAATMADAFSGAVGSPLGGEEFVSPTKSITLGNMWYGVLEYTDFVGSNTEDYSKDIIAIITTAQNGIPFFEVYTDSSMTDEYVELSMYITLYDDSFVADIGDKDAWISQRYLTKEDEQYFMPTLENGAIDITYRYVDPDNEYSCTMRFFLREDGTPWDEKNDPLPPSYDRYKAALAEGEEVDIGGGDYGKTTADADGIVDFDTLKSGFAWLSNAIGSEGGYQRPTYEEIKAKLGGVHGKKTHESSWESDYHVYEWTTTGGDFLLLSFKVHEDGSETWNSSSWSSSLKD